MSNVDQAYCWGYIRIADLVCAGVGNLINRSDLATFIRRRAQGSVQYFTCTSTRNIMKTWSVFLLETYMGATVTARLC